MRPCDHLYGIIDVEGGEGGATWYYGPPSEEVRKDYRFESFKFCPHCGEQLIKDDK